MKNKWLTFIFVITITIVCLSANNVKQTSTIEEPDVSKQFLKLLQSGDQKEREEGVNIIQEQYIKLIGGLIEIVSKQIEIPKTIQDIEFIQHDTKYRSIILLGDLRAAKAVPVLLENLEYKNPNITSLGEFSEIGQLFISAGALIKIGIPAVEPVLDKLCMFNSSKRDGAICCDILRSILGSKLAMARIQIAIDETKDETVKKNLSEALTYIKNRY